MKEWGLRFLIATGLLLPSCSGAIPVPVTATERSPTSTITATSTATRTATATSTVTPIFTETPTRTATSTITSTPNIQRIHICCASNAERLMPLLNRPDFLKIITEKTHTEFTALGIGGLNFQTAQENLDKLLPPNSLLPGTVLVIDGLPMNGAIRRQTPNDNFDGLLKLAPELKNRAGKDTRIIINEIRPATIIDEESIDKFNLVLSRRFDELGPGFTLARINKCFKKQDGSINTDLLSPDGLHYLNDEAFIFFLRVQDAMIRGESCPK